MLLPQNQDAPIQEEVEQTAPEQQAEATSPTSSEEALWQEEIVRYPMAKARGLCLDSTATQHTSKGVLLWLLCPTHQGDLTLRPCSSSLAG